MPRMILKHKNALIDDKAEVGVLEAAIEEPSAAKFAFQLLTALDFADPRRAKLFILCKRIHTSQALDRERVRLRIANLKPEDKIACEEAFAETMDMSVLNSALNIGAYIERLKELHVRRISIKKAEELRVRATDMECDIAKEFDSANAEISSKRSRAVVIGHMQQYDAEAEESKAGKRRAVKFPWPHISLATQALRPGSPVVLAGSPGASKSLALNQCLYHWHLEHQIAVLELEDGATYHMRRALAQMSGDARVTNEDWVFENPHLFDALNEQYRAQLDSFGACLNELHRDETATEEFVLDWVSDHVRRGTRIIAVDPFTKIDFGGVNLGRAHDHFLSRVEAMIRGKASFLLVTHPKQLTFKGRGSMTMDDLAGGAAISRFTHCILYLATHPPKQVLVNSPQDPNKLVTINRTIKIWKARNSYGAHSEIGFWFNKEALTLEEIGEIKD